MTDLLGFGVARVSAVCSGRFEQCAADGVDNTVSRSDSQDACSEAVGASGCVVGAGLGAGLGRVDGPEGERDVTGGDAAAVHTAGRNHAGLARMSGRRGRSAMAQTA